MRRSLAIVILAALACTAAPAAARPSRAPAPASTDSLAFAERLHRRGVALADADSLDQAQAALEPALAIARRADPAGREVAAVLGTLGNLAYRRAHFAEAAALLHESRDRLERAVGPDSAVTLMATNNLGRALQAMEDPLGARREFERVLEVVRRTLPGDTTAVASAEVALAGALRDLHDGEGARALYQQALARLDAAGRTETPFYALACHRYAILLRLAGEYDRALVMARRALAWRLRVLGPEDIETANSLGTVGNLLADLGHFDEAARMTEQSLRIYTQHRGPGDPNTLTRLISLGNLARARGDQPAAESLFVRLVAGRTAVQGRQRIGVAEALYDLALARQSLGRDSLAIAGALEATAIRRDAWHAIIPFLDENAAMRLTSEYWTGYEIAVDEVAHQHRADSASVAATWAAVTQMRTLVLDEVAARRTDRAEAQPGDVRALWDRWTDARRRLSRAVLGSGPRDSLAALADSLEREVAARNAVVRARRRERGLAWGEVARSLGHGDALVGFVRYGRVDQRTPLSRWQKDLVFEYAAFVLAPGDPGPHAIALGSATAIDSLVDRWATAIESGGTDPAALRRYRAAGRALRAATWDPLASRLAGARRVFIVPDGALHRVAWETLPTSTGRYLLDDPRLLVRLFSERDLVASARPAGEGRGLLAVGGVDFDSAAATPASALVASRVRGVAASCSEFARVRFERLPGTADEVHGLGALWNSRQREPAQVLDGRAASKAAFLAASPGRAYLHVATHGFFVSDSCGPDSLVRAGWLGDPLDRCGLVLAGANARSVRGPGGDDGLLTGGDIVTLDLHGLQWAVLSACRSGQGEIDRTEGVYGLQRAFRIAGARAVVMSLWPVEDDAARMWMTELYAGHLERGLPTALAARAASRAVRASLLRAGRADHPRLWGAFVAAGDPR